MVVLFRQDDVPAVVAVRAAVRHDVAGSEALVGLRVGQEVAASTAVDAGDGLGSIHWDQCRLWGHRSLHPVACAAMRVIGGTHRGRRIEAVEGLGVRPTSDRAREAVFNTLFSMGFPQGAVVVDAFAGTGALGIEALSRGAARVSFVEQHPRACAVIEKNLASLGLQGEVVRGDATVVLGGLDPQPDLVLADPPYEFDDWERFLAGCPPSAVVMIESDRPVDPPEGSGRVVLRQRKYGRAVVTILSPDGGGDGEM